MRSTGDWAVALIWLALIAAMFGCMAAMKENGATDHPLLVDSAARAVPPRACPGFEAHPCARVDFSRRIA